MPLYKETKLRIETRIIRIIIVNIGVCVRSDNMLNYIWAFMILISVVYGICTGQVDEITVGALEGAGDAVSLCVTMAGVMALWMGVMEIARQAGLITGLARGISPFLNLMFPGIPRKHEAREYIATNLIANVLGLGWACTPAGLKAMEALAELEEERCGERACSGGASGEGRMNGRAASNEMCNFLILNIASLQLISVNMIAYRSQYGSADPAAAIAPSIVATVCSTVVGILYCKWKDRSKKSGKR